MADDEAQPFLSDDEKARAQARGDAVDRVQTLRNTLVMVAQDHPDPGVRQKALARLESLPKYDPAAPTPRTQEPLSPPRKTDRELAGEMRYDSPMIQGGTTDRGEAVQAYAPGVLPKPLIDLSNAAKRRQQLGKLADTMTFGGATKIASHFGSDYSPEQMEKDRQEAPLDPSEEGALQVAGTFLGGPRALASGAEKVMLGAGTRKLAQTSPRIAAAVTGGGSAALTAGGTKALNAKVGEGQDWLEALRQGGEAATDPVNAGVGTALGGMFGQGTLTREGNPNVRLIEQEGGKVGASTPGSGKPFEDPLVKQGINEEGRVTEAGRGKAARATARATDDVLGSKVKDIDDAMEAAKQAARTSGSADEPIDVTAAVRKIYETAHDPWVDSSVREKLKTDVIKDIFGGRNPFEAGTTGEPGMSKPPTIRMSAENANKLRKKLFDAAGVVNPKATEPTMEGLAHDVKAHVDESDYGKINAPYREEAKKIENSRKALEYPNYKDIHSRLETPADQMKVANVLSRMGQDTARAGMQQTPELEQLKLDYPELGKIAKTVPLLDARSALEFKGLKDLPSGGLYMKNLMKWLGQNMEAGKVRLAAPALIGAGKTAPVAGMSLRALADAAKRKLNEGRDEQ